MKTTVYVVCKNVDQGYHMVRGFVSYDAALAEFNRMEQKEREKQIAMVIKDRGYSLHAAERWVSDDEYFELNELEIEL